MEVAIVITSPPANTTQLVDVLSFNILNPNWASSNDPPWPIRKPDVVSTIASRSSDFVCTQEETDQTMSDILMELPEYHEVPGRGISGGILYLHHEWTLLDNGSEIFERNDPGNSLDRYFIWGLFENKETLKKIYVYSLHLPFEPGQATDADRVTGMRQLIEHVGNQPSNSPVVIGGDFNAETFENPMKTLTGEIPPISNPTFEYAYKDTYTSGASNGIDHILILPMSSTISSGILASRKWASGSDHPAVYATISIT
jgi:hypothetical protein